jgi:chromosome segregation ATPase
MGENHVEVENRRLTFALSQSQASASTYQQRLKEAQALSDERLEKIASLDATVTIEGQRAARLEQEVATLKRQLATANAARSDAEAREQAAAQREQEAWRQVRTLEAAVRDLYDDFRSASEAVRQAGDCGVVE